MQYSMLENGMDFIISGILHLQKAESENVEENIQGRELKYALLHLSSGIELVFKSRLNIEHWTYIFEDMNKASKNSYKDGSLKTADSNTAIDRLEKLIDVDEIWNVTANDEVRFKRLMERKGITEEIARRIMEIQSEFENENYDILSVENNGDFEELKDKLDLFFKNSCINEGKKIGFFGKLKKSKQEEAEEDKAIVEDKTEDADVVRKLTEDELKAMNTAEEVFNDHPLEKENLDNNENLDGFMKSVFANEQSTENVDLKNLESQNSLNMEKTKLTDLSPLREEKLDSTNSAKNGINNSNEEFFEEEVVEDTKKDKGKKKKKKMKMWKKILITIITVLIICKALFLGAVYYGGKNYPINYIEEIQKYSNEYGVDPKVVLAIMRVESNFKSDAVSKVNAKGLMQVLPDTAKHVAKLLNVNVNSVDLNDPETNVKFGTYYLKYLMQNFSNMDTVYAAYNGGIGNVNTWLKDSKYSNDGVSLYNIPSAETKNYVNKVNKALKAYEILYGKEFPTKKTKGFAKFIDNVKNAVRYIFRNF